MSKTYNTKQKKDRSMTSRVKFSQATIAKIAECTDRNDHGQAILLGVQMLGLESIAKRIKLVREIHLIQGWLDADLYNYRNGLHREMMTESKKLLSPEQQKAFHGAY